MLSCVATMGELGRMVQYKTKSEGRDSVSVGLFTYPVLQAADVLLYQGERVPVGDDQRQHLELMRDVAIRFNSRYGTDVQGARRGHPAAPAPASWTCRQPDKKMSTTGGTELGTILILDPPVAAEEEDHVGASPTPAPRCARPPTSPGVTALLEILATVTDTPIPVLEDRYAGAGYGAFKSDVLDAVVAYLEPIQTRYAELARRSGRRARGARAGRRQGARAGGADDGPRARGGRAPADALSAVRRGGACRGPAVCVGAIACSDAGEAPVLRARRSRGGGSRGRG